MESKDYDPKARRSGKTDGYVAFVNRNFRWDTYTFYTNMYIPRNHCYFKKGDIMFANTLGLYSFIVKGVYPAKGQKRKNQMLVKIEKFQHGE